MDFTDMTPDQIADVAFADHIKWAAEDNRGIYFERQYGISLEYLKHLFTWWLQESSTGAVARKEYGLSGRWVVEFLIDRERGKAAVRFINKTK